MTDTEERVAEADGRETGTPESATKNEDAPVLGAGGSARYVLAGIAIVLTFFAAYGYAASTRQSETAYAGSGGAAPAAAPAVTPAAGSGACGSGTGACSDCANAAPAGEAPKASAALKDGVQRISVDVSKGYFDPTEIRVVAGAPIEITFGAGSGCLAQVLFKDFDVLEDLTDGGGVVRLPALQKGTYTFSCGMEMVFGKVIAE